MEHGWEVEVGGEGGRLADGRRVQVKVWLRGRRRSESRKQDRKVIL